MTHPTTQTAKPRGARMRVMMKFNARVNTAPVELLHHQYSPESGEHVSVRVSAVGSGDALEGLIGKDEAIALAREVLMAYGIAEVDPDLPPPLKVGQQSTSFSDGYFGPAAYGLKTVVAAGGEGPHRWATIRLESGAQDTFDGLALREISRAWSEGE